MRKKAEKVVSIFTAAAIMLSGVPVWASEGGTAENEIEVEAEAKTSESAVLPLDAAHIPDEIFREYVRTEFDKNEDGILSEEEIQAVTSIYVSETNIGNLQGIEYLKYLEELWCWDTKISSLDVSQNANLKGLWCYSTQLSSLDVSQNANLESLWCYSTQISSLDVSQNANLEYLDCSYTQLSSLDVSQNPNLEYLDCSYTQLSSLDVSQNLNLEWLSCSPQTVPAAGLLQPDGTISLKSLVGEENLGRVSVESREGKYEYDSGTGTLHVENPATAAVLYQYDVGYNGEKMTVYLELGTTEELPLDAIHIPDGVFREYLRKAFDKNQDWILSEEEIEAATSIDVGETDIGNLQGIEYLKYLERLDCYSTLISSLDVSQNPNLEDLRCYETQISSLDVSQNPNLKGLWCGITQISSLDVSQNPNLEELSCDNTQLSSLDVSQNPKLRVLECSPQTVPAAGLLQSDGTISLKSLVGEENLGRVSVESREGKYEYDSGTGTLHVANPAVAAVFYQYDVGFNGEKMIVYLELGTTEELPLDAIHIPDKTFRKYLRGAFDKNGDWILSEEEIQAVTSINVRGTDIGNLQGIEYLKYLEELDCSNTQLSSLDVSQNANLKGLWCYDTHLSSLDVSRNANLKELSCSSTKISSLDVSQNASLERLDCSYTHLSSLDVSQNPNLKYLYCYETQLSSLDVSRNANLEELSCSYTQLSSLDVSQNASLRYLDCYDTHLSSLDVSRNANLEELSCSYTQLSSLDVSQNASLRSLYCYSTQIRSLDVSQNPNLESLDCSSTHLSSLDVSQNANLEYLDCSSTHLSSLDVSQNASLRSLYCYSTQIRSLDVSQNPNLWDLECSPQRVPAAGLLQPDGTISLKSLVGEENLGRVSVEPSEGTYDPGTGTLHVANPAAAEVSYQYDVGFEGEKMTVALDLKTMGPENPVQVEGIALNVNTLHINPGSSYKLTATVLPDNAADKEITWSSSNTNTAIVDGAGNVKAVNGGTATITAASKNGRNASCVVTVPYTITYKLNGGRNASANPAYYFGQKVTLKAPTRKGYVFKGWYTASNYKTGIKTIQADSAGNLTLYAKWEKVKTGKAAIASVKNLSGKKIKVSLKKVSGAKGYEILSATDKKFKKGRKILKLEKNTGTITKLKKGKKYYVKARAYKLDSEGKKVYGKYSAVKNVTVRK